MNDSEKTKFLLKRISESDAEAFRNFYDLFYIRLYRFSGYFVKSDQLKEEIVSDVFFSVWQGRKNLVDVLNIESYLYKSIRNRSLYYINHAKNDNLIDLAQLPIDFQFHNDTPENITISNEAILAIRKAIADLPDRCRLIFLMAKEEGLKYKEIAQILSISTKTVNAQMVVAIKKLSEALRKHITSFLYIL
jgi:RNA polymerase sigma-70 factor (family 1)